jgi:hypothetical protein
MKLAPPRRFLACLLLALGAEAASGRGLLRGQTPADPRGLQAAAAAAEGANAAAAAVDAAKYTQGPVGIEPATAAPGPVVPAEPAAVDPAAAAAAAGGKQVVAPQQEQEGEGSEGKVQVLRTEHHGPCYYKGTC